MSVQFGAGSKAVPALARDPRKIQAAIVLVGTAYCEVCEVR
jgi:hypothetical protein